MVWPLGLTLYLGPHQLSPSSFIPSSSWKSQLKYDLFRLAFPDTCSDPIIPPPYFQSTLPDTHTVFSDFSFSPAKPQNSWRWRPCLLTPQHLAHHWEHGWNWMHVNEWWTSRCPQRLTKYCEYKQKHRQDMDTAYLAAVYVKVGLLRKQRVMEGHFGQQWPMTSR